MANKKKERKEQNGNKNIQNVNKQNGKDVEMFPLRKEDSIEIQTLCVVCLDQPCL